MELGWRSGIEWGWSGDGVGMEWGWSGDGVGMEWGWSGDGVGMEWGWSGDGGVVITELFVGIEKNNCCLERLKA